MHYPSDLIAPLRKKWGVRSRGGKTPLPSNEVLREFLEVAYHASFRTEENRGIAFRAIMLDNAYSPPTGPRLSGVPSSTVVKLQKPRPYSVDELLRLAPATDPTKVMIAVAPSKSLSSQVRVDRPLAIWGLLDVGSSWWRLAHGESDSAWAPPSGLTVDCNEPGALQVSDGGNLLLGLRGGAIRQSTHGVLSGGPIGVVFDEGADHFVEEVRKQAKGLRDSVDERRDIRSACIEVYARVIQRIAAARHGGTLIVVPNEWSIGDTRLSDRVTIKYVCSHTNAWHCALRATILRTEYYSQWSRLVESTKSIAAAEFRRCHGLRNAVEEAGEALTEAIGFLASLSGVDGAIVMSDQLRLIGFGAEVTAQSPQLTNVRIASNLEGAIGVTSGIEVFGTRHRSAFRFCSSTDDAVAFVVSQDGGAKAVRRVGNAVVVWPDIQYDLVV